MRPLRRSLALVAATAAVGCASTGPKAPPPLSNERTAVSVAPLGAPKRITDPVPGWSDTGATGHPVGPAPIVVEPPPAGVPSARVPALKAGCWWCGDYRQVEPPTGAAQRICGPTWKSCPTASTLDDRSIWRLAGRCACDG